MIEADRHSSLHVDFGKFLPKLASYVNYLFARFSLDATLANIHIKLSIYCQNACIFDSDNMGIVIQKFVVNSNTSIFETRVLNYGPSVSSPKPILPIDHQQ